MLKCYNTIGQKEIMPTVAVKKFDDWSKISSPPFVLYGDIEVLLIPPSSPKDNSNKKVTNNSNILQTHASYVVGSYLVPHQALADSYFKENNDGEKQPSVKFHEGCTCMKDFCLYLNKLMYRIYNFNKKHCRKPQHARAKKVFSQFQCQNMCDYLLHYLELDCLLSWPLTFHHWSMIFHQKKFQKKFGEKS